MHWEFLYIISTRVLRRYTFLAGLLLWCVCLCMSVCLRSNCSSLGTPGSAPSESLTAVSGSPPFPSNLLVFLFFFFFFYLNSILPFTPHTTTPSFYRLSIIRLLCITCDFSNNLRSFLFIFFSSVFTTPHPPPSSQSWALSPHLPSIASFFFPPRFPHSLTFCPFSLEQGPLTTPPESALCFITCSPEQKTHTRPHGCTHVYTQPISDRISIRHFCKCFTSWKDKEQNISALMLVVLTFRCDEKKKSFQPISVIYVVFRPTQKPSICIVILFPSAQ